MPYLEPIQADYERDRRIALAQSLRNPGVKPSNKAGVIAQLLSNILAGRQEDEARGEFDEKQAQYDAALQGLGGADTPEAFQQAIASDPYLARQMAPVMAKQRYEQMFKGQDEGFTLGEGQQRFDAKGNPIASGPPKAEVATNDVREYEFAQSQGYKGTFADWTARKAQNGQGASPYFQFLPTAGGYAVGDARTGRINAPGSGGTQAIIPATVDVPLQTQLATGKAEGGKIGEGRGEFTASEEKKAATATETLAILDEAERLLGTATGSGIGKLADAGAAFFGKDTEGANAARQLDILGAKLVTQVPRMEGPQSNYDVQLYKQAAGDLANSGLPTETRLAALGQMRKIAERYAGKQQTGAAPQPGEVRKGYRFKGGNPADKNSWERAK